MKKDKLRYNQVIRTLHDKDKTIGKNDTIDMIIMYIFSKVQMYIYMMTNI